MRKCNNKKCNQILRNRWQQKFCSNICQQKQRHKDFIEQWISGEVDGMGINGDISEHVRNFLLQKSKNKCSLCGWNKKHPISGKVPLHIDHADGNANNNKPNNLRVLCPNCHALTPTFGGLNRGNGRLIRRERYKSLC